MGFSSSEENAYFAIKNALKFSKVKVSNKTLKEVLINHPDFPTLACFKDVFNTFNVEILPTKININTITKLDLPLLAHIEDFDGAYFIVITKISGGIVTYYINKECVTELFYDFLKKWHGIICIIFINDELGEAGYYKKIFQTAINLKNKFVFKKLI
ncbi:cysteine peptidase family C39 domain-containing protein [Runella salmonicolor]|uniref:Cysteine peptidase family C39 domain-containing protein n=1 Tax=Runella salmonicolor TaxID=2950278 RepID=A0ABT1FR43_9BACT|nr:cysteine peptidase family C39 domain-containing protein [Runella salmonicolor]MCP1383088.1 cysteine peptidase family C39 domain-containing protein [Runella salmonicolor]